MLSSNRLPRLLFFGWCFASLVLLWFICRANGYDRSIALHTLLLGLSAAIVSVPLGFGLAWVCLGNRFYNRMMLLVTVSLLAIPVFLHVSTWDAAFGRLGWMKTPGVHTLQPLIGGWTAASWIHGVAAAPQVAIILLIGFVFGRQSVEEQALLDMSRGKVFWLIRIRRMIPLFVLAVLWTIVAAAREIAATDLYQIGTLAEQIYLGYSLGQFNAIVGGWSADDLAAAANLNYWLAIIVLLWLAVTSALLCLTLIEQERETEITAGQTPFNRADVLESPASGKLKQICAGFLILVLLVGPLANLLIRGSFYIDTVGGTPVPQYSIGQLADVLHRSVWNYQREFVWTVLIGISTSLAIMVLATTIVWKARHSSAAVLILGWTWVISCTLPGPLIGTLIGGLFHVADWAWVEYLFNRTILAPVLATMIFCWPFPPLILWFVFRKVSSEMIDSARLERAGEWTIFWQFGVRDHLPTLFGCWLVTLAICLGELSASQMVLPPGIDTLPRLMLGLLHAGVEEMTAGITLVLMALIGIISCTGWKITQWGARI
jgi:iron(III) transport system permease protein